MLAVLCSRSKPRFLSAFLSSFAHASPLHHHNHLYGRLAHGPISGSGSGPGIGAVQFGDLAVGYTRHDSQRRHHSSACQLGPASCGGAASIWHAILPSDGCRRSCDRRRRQAIHFDLNKGEGSWNAALDARPARWLHRADSAWLLFGVCACLAPVVDCWADAVNAEPPVSEQKVVVSGSQASFSDGVIDSSANYRVTGYYLLLLFLEKIV